MEAIKEYNRVCAEIIIENFAKRNIEGFFCPTAEDAVQKALDLIKKGSTVSWGGSMTLQEIGLLDKLKDYDYNLLDRSTAESDDEKIKIYHDALSADYYLMSSNAITQDGKLVNIDGNGNRIAALIYGPEKVIIIAGMNKVTKDEESAMKRIRNYASPANTIRLEKDTPCTTTGKCHDCLVDDCICCQILVTRKSCHDDRIKVILVGEKLGF